MLGYDRAFPPSRCRQRGGEGMDDGAACAQLLKAEGVGATGRVRRPQANAPGPGVKSSGVALSLGHGSSNLPGFDQRAKTIGLDKAATA